MSPLQLHICKISFVTALELNKLWHSRLPLLTPNSFHMNKHKICFGALYNNVWYASAIFTDPISRIFNYKNYLELRRMAISSDAPKNTASRMLSIMVKIIKRELPQIIKIVSYQDSEVHTGTIYKASGWKLANVGEKPGWNRSNSEIGKRKRIALNKKIIADSPKIRWEKQIRPEPNGAELLIKQVTDEMKHRPKQRQLF